MSPRTLLLMLVATGLMGCSGRLPPSSPRFLAGPEPSSITVAMGEGAVASVQNVRVKVVTFPRSEGEGLIVREVSIAYYEVQNNQPIPSLDFPRQALASPIAVPPPTTEQGASISFDVPIYRPEVGQYGLHASTLINAEVNLYGTTSEHDGFQLHFNVPIQFIPSDPT